MQNENSDYEGLFSSSSRPFASRSIPLNEESRISEIEGYDTDSLETFRSFPSAHSRAFTSHEYPSGFEVSQTCSFRSFGYPGADVGFMRSVDYDFRGMQSSEYPFSSSCDEAYSSSQLFRSESYRASAEGDGCEFRTLPSRPLRVICAGPSFQIGGVEQHTISLAKFFDTRRVKLVKSVVTNPKGFDKQSLGRIPFPVEPCSPEGLVQASRECDVLLMWGEGFNDRLGENRPIGIYLAHGESPWTRLGLEGSSRVVDHVIAVSSRVRKLVCEGFPATTILNGIDAARLSQTCSRDVMRSRLGFSSGDFVVGSVGRFTNEKRMHLLIDAVARLPKRFKLLLVGYGTRRVELLDRANELIPGRFAFVSRDDYLGDYYGAMDAFGLLSAHEGFGLVIAEAMLCERPVFATNVGCVPEVIRDRISGLVVTPSPEMIATSIHNLSSHPHWASGLAKEGRVFAETHLHASRMARQYEDLLWRLARLRGLS